MEISYVRRNTIPPHMRAHLIGCQISNLTPNQVGINKSMSRVHPSVEWTFKKVKNYFTNVEFQRNKIILLRWKSTFVRHSFNDPLPIAMMAMGRGSLKDALVDLSEYPVGPPEEGC